MPKGPFGHDGNIAAELGSEGGRLLRAGPATTAHQHDRSRLRVARPGVHVHERRDRLRGHHVRYDTTRRANVLAPDLDVRQAELAHHELKERRAAPPSLDQDDARMRNQTGHRDPGQADPGTHVQDGRSRRGDVPHHLRVRTGLGEMPIEVRQAPARHQIERGVVALDEGTVLGQPFSCGLFHVKHAAT